MSQLSEAVNLADSKKTPKKSPDRPGKHGGVLLTGNPGNKGGTGRPPNAFKDFVRAEIRDSQTARDALVTAAQDATSRNFANAWKIATDYDDDKPAEKKELSGAVTVVVKIEREGRRITR